MSASYDVLDLATVQRRSLNAYACACSMLAEVNLAPTEAATLQGVLVALRLGLAEAHKNGSVSVLEEVGGFVEDVSRLEGQPFHFTVALSEDVVAEALQRLDTLWHTGARQ